jgi:Trk K+ transport system NAD-binding subunit
MDVVFSGPDEAGLAAALRERGVDVTHIEGIANRPALEEAGIHDADVFLLTDVGQATSIVVARDLNPDLRVVAYTSDSLPEFVSGQRVLAMDPELLDPDAVAEEIVEA